eukprot:CAMPEP_0170418458 /NCGR_PEP_ID=MMETSP0117_2-20130122/34273_1 /TAXON_ID=400756 /ORGANISM="Durinskia baltica, Strain CSIRO CS-38" /LENGTH=558 /DNA_ID=CAMNT_0010676737 /DNA_START=8 /DNA_END=1681 /DNA_ORIENTATION=+
MASMDSIVQSVVQAEMQQAIATMKEAMAAEVQRVEKSVAALSDRCAAVEASTQELAGSVAEQRELPGSLVADLRAEIEDQLSPLRLRLGRVESDADGPGGLQQLSDRLHQVTQELAAVEPRLQEQAKLTRSLRDHVDRIDESEAALRQQCESLREDLQKSEQSLHATEISRMSVENRQTALEDRLSQKHEELWQDVHRAVDEARKESVAALQEDMAKRRTEMKSLGSSHVKYVTALLANTHTERKSLEMCKGLLQVWKEYTWSDARRKTGVRLIVIALARAKQNRERRAVDRWARAASIEGLAHRLREECKGQIPDVHQIVQSASSALHDKCDKLQTHVDGLQTHVDGLRGELDSKCTSASLQEAAEAHRKEVEAVKSKMTEHHEAIAQTDKKHDDHREALEAHRSDLQALLNEHTERLETCAKSSEVQSMMHDVLVIWSSIKQLDAAKADKATVDAFALEMASTYKVSAKRAEDLQSDIAGKVRDETARVRSDVDSKLVQWEQMWGKLAELVEDLLTKVTDLQATRGGRSRDRDRGGSVGRDALAAESGAAAGVTLR